MTVPLGQMIMANTCPDCGGQGFYAGPEGGMSQNIKCANDACGSEFNVTPFPGHFRAERIGAKATAKQRAYDKRTDRKFNDLIVASAKEPFWLRLFKRR